MIVQAILDDSPYWEFLKTVAIIVGSISSFVFVALFGRLPIFRRTPIGWINRVLLVHIPNAVVKVDEILTGRRITTGLSRLLNYLMYDRHPLVMIFFLTLQIAGESMFIPAAWPHLSGFQTYIVIPLLAASPYITLYKSYKTSPAITRGNFHDALRLYPYDYVLYHPHQECRTCHFAKPARSKHCSICKHCVSRHDHHCIWINNCVGAANYHWFMLLLIAMATMLLYGALTSYSILEAALQARFVPPRLTRGSITRKHWATPLTWSAWVEAWSWAIANNARLGATGLLCAMSFPLATGFLVYHAYLIWAGTTTNETAKWADLREDIYDGIVWKARMRDVYMEYPTPLDERAVYQGREPPRWPVRAEWWVIRTRQGEQPIRRVWKTQQQQENKGNAISDDTSKTRVDANQEWEDLPDDRWQSVKSLNEVINVYDLGWVDNLRESLMILD